MGDRDKITAPRDISMGARDKNVGARDEMVAAHNKVQSMDNYNYGRAEEWKDGNVCIVTKE